MRRITGIVAEYDPFHRGHGKHMLLARERTGAEFIYVALSGCFRQRGDAAMLSPWDRARCALDAGADAVFLLPTVWTLRDAEHYALGAVALLGGMGANCLAFGAEQGDVRILSDIAERLEHPDAAFQGRLREALAAGNGYPRAVEMALGAEDPRWGQIMRRPNNILAIAYLRAIRRLGLEMEPVAIPREGAYDAEKIDGENPSASAIRRAVERGDYGSAFPALTGESERVLRRALLDHRISEPGMLDALTLRTLRTMEPEEAEKRLTDLSEGLANRILREAGSAASRRELLDRVCGKRYPRGRINRILTRAALGIPPEMMAETPEFREALLLGMRPDPGMTGDWKAREIQVRSNIKDMPADPAFSLWGQCAGLGEDWAYREKTVTG